MKDGKLKRLLLATSDIDASMRPLIEKWDEPPTAIQVMEVLDLCVFGSLASSFYVSIFQVLYESALKREGKTHEEMLSLATWRTDNQR